VGTAAGSRLTFRLVALAVLMASGAAGVAAVGPGRGPAPAGSGRDTRMLGSSLSQPGADPDTDPATAPGSGPSASDPASGGGARGTADRFNVDAPHSPELLRLLAEVPVKSGKAGGAGNAGQAAATAGMGAGAAAAPSTPAPSTPSPSPTAPGTPAPGTVSPAGTAQGGTAQAGTAQAGTAQAGTAQAGTGAAGTAPGRTAPAGTGAKAPATARRHGTSAAEGVDVAAAQHPGGAPIDWTKVAAAGYTFAAIKSTEGDYYTNPYGTADLAGAKTAGLYVTGYHFAIPNVSGGAAQADFAVSHGAYAAGRRTSRLELDIEYDPYTGTDRTNACYGLYPAQMVSWIDAFGTEARRLTGQRPVIYTTAAWWATCTGGSITFGTDLLWVAAPALAGPATPAGPAGPVTPAGWSGWAFWQFTSGATVPGIRSAGNIDVSEADGSRLALLKPGPRPGATDAAGLAPSAGTSGRAVAPSGS
jgi:GH25 family lysozyme M1 (1,4-beta-N-acetylmuramidase)